MVKLKSGLLLQVKRKEKGWTQEQLGKYLGLSRQTISLYERNILIPRPKHMKKISEVLDTDIKELFFND